MKIKIMGRNGGRERWKRRDEMEVTKGVDTGSRYTVQSAK